MVTRSLTGIIRPFQTPSVQPPALAQAAPDGSAPPQNTKLVIGRGAPKTFTGSFDLTVSYYKVRKPKEKPAPAS